MSNLAFKLAIVCFLFVQYFSVNIKTKVARFRFLKETNEYLFFKELNL
jgi:hypothetical protein